jgi:glutaredoxin
MKLLPQKCSLILLYLTWILYIGGIIYFTINNQYLTALAWLIIIPLGLWINIRLFPNISKYLGYGSVEDVPADGKSYGAREVILYTSLGCPFCPIVEKRLRALSEETGFKFTIIDVTFRPKVISSKGIKSVPVVEADGRRIVGNATTSELTALVAGTKKS